jgi:hypothetical protein
LSCNAYLHAGLEIITPLGDNAIVSLPDIA